MAAASGRRMIREMDEHVEPVDDADEEDDCEVFDVQLWAERYRADEEAQDEFARLAGVPFH